MSLSYRNQLIDLKNKSIDWFLYDSELRHERVNMEHLQKVFLNLCDAAMISVFAKI